MNDTIFALSSGQPPAGIAVIRVSGSQAGAALSALAGRLPQPRRATFVRLRDDAGAELDAGLILWLPGPGSATGEDLAEFHLHGGRAVVEAVESALRTFGLRRAEAGEFTRRAFANGRIDLAEAEGLADLLSAETELQRRSALAMAGGTFSRQAEEWRSHLLTLAARVEAVLDFADQDDVSALPEDFGRELSVLEREVAAWLSRPHAEVLKEGYRVVLAGPPNAGKSTLFNALVESNAAITAPTAGTTRDVITRSVAMGGVPFTFVDTAGVRHASDDAIEMIGIDRAHAEMDRADLVLWLGPEGEGPSGETWEIQAQTDRNDCVVKRTPRYSVSAVTGEGLATLKLALIENARRKMPKPGEAALNARQRELVAQMHQGIESALREDDPLLLAEQLRLARVALDRLVGRATTEDMLDALFGSFCIGK
ncbi:tRNA uridine(34) 5-carboxymethylaminomethyl synthesis GTPase MnmE [Croceicoccus estronivorus]|uniref:tRNA uridine-5-carboxymethylaminomethyl(34) synthesis GTPase MnmE n=1 Tax=Croceicoccus estronivorus TaxID=1172626 RepID=UPI00082F4B29|nr:tRNA uridine-5-carboxymethylaminomethyl(34) synthesis GTPase MnmE [Croceicoccus estronivorus]OCC24001.1 tRNA uridine(34) 5-carboxymethylaminomethyl synthesis GTPase MnmE [Croceicoccus estronivorus]